MSLKLNYKSGLILFYNLLRSEHEAGADGTKGIMISDKDSPNGDLGPVYGNKLTVPGNQLQSIMAVLRVCSYAKRVKALAWVKREMLINAHVLVEDSPTYRKVMEEFRITEKEVNLAMVKIS